MRKEKKHAKSVPQDLMHRMKVARIAQVAQVAPEAKAQVRQYASNATRVQLL